MKIYSGHYILVVFSLLTTVAAAFGYYVLYGQVVAQAESSSQAMQAVGLEVGRKEQEGQLLKLYDETKVKRAKLASSFVAEDKVVDFIEEVEAIGADTSTTLELSSLAKEEGRIKAHIEVKGSWSGVMRALMIIENMPYSISVKDIRLIAAGDASGDLKKTSSRTWNLSLDFSVLTL